MRTKAHSDLIKVTVIAAFTFGSTAFSKPLANKKQSEAADESIWVRRILTAYKARRFNEITRDLEHLRGWRHISSEDLLRISDILLNNLGRPEDALSSAQEALKLAPHDRAALAAVARAYRELGRYEEAISNYREAIKRSAGPNYGLELELAETYRQAGRFKEAISAFAAINLANPVVARAYYDEGYSRVSRGGPDADLGAFKTMVSRYLDNPMAHHHYAAALWMTGRRDRRELAKREFEEALRLHHKGGDTTGEDYVHTLDWMALAVAADGRFQEALEYALEARRLVDASSGLRGSIFAEIIDIYLAWGKMDLALETADAISAPGDWPEICRNLNVMADRMEHTDVALRWEGLKGFAGFRHIDITRAIQCVQEEGLPSNARDCLTGSGFSEEAVAEFVRTTEGCAPAFSCASSQKAELHMALAHLYFRCLRRSEAALEWLAALKFYRTLHEANNEKKVETLLLTYAEP